VTTADKNITAHSYW